MDVSTSGENFNYTEVAGTGGLLIPNAVTLIKVERRRGRGGAAEQQGSNSIQSGKKKESCDLSLWHPAASFCMQSH